MTTSQPGARRTALVLAFAAGGVLSAPRPARAALGDSLASIQSDQAHLQGSLRTAPMEGYLLHEIQAPTGTVVREFSSPAGAVFGVSWEGPFLPDLHRILGPSYDSYVEAARAGRRGRGPLILHLQNLVFESAGHPRGFHGRAYIPQLLPEGVPAEAVR
ncbi:MAG TPA: DUF2844 domain-containing protein [Vicinamibacteria bacterium]|nr:DUF2844 domain-containing protein [Vicinamibacteria bacterium]